MRNAECGMGKDGRADQIGERTPVDSQRFDSMILYLRASNEHILCCFPDHLYIFVVRSDFKLHTIGPLSGGISPSCLSRNSKSAFAEKGKARFVRFCNGQCDFQRLLPGQDFL